MNKKLDDFFNDVFKEFNKDITDRIFLMIQNDPKLMKDYLKLIEDNEIGRDNLNTSLGKAIKENYDLDNLDENNEPISTLIKSYTKHE